MSLHPSMRGTFRGFYGTDAHGPLAQSIHFGCHSASSPCSVPPPSWKNTCCPIFRPRLQQLEEHECYQKTSAVSYFPAFYTSGNAILIWWMCLQRVALHGIASHGITSQKLRPPQITFDHILHNATPHHTTSHFSSHRIM
jgi:hypothetical protein